MFSSYTGIQFSHLEVTIIKIEAKDTQNMFTFYLTAAAVFILWSAFRKPCLASWDT